VCIFSRSRNDRLLYIVDMMTTGTTVGRTVALYARVSTKDGGQDSENQLIQLRKFAATQGWEIVAEFTDKATGGGSDRDQLQAMFAAASKRQFDILLFWALDRFSREGTVKTLNHLERLTGYGVDYRSYTEQYIDSCGMFRDAIIGILAAIGHQERVRLSERTKAGLERAKAQGRVGGRPQVADHDKIEALVSLRSQGKSIRWVATELKLSVGTVATLCKRHTVGPTSRFPNASLTVAGR
jgi:DNA invertase Pin-like site-specific DNA recombinase